MKEAIATRVGRLIVGSVNALIDAVEGAAPDVVLQQSLRDIDRTVDELRGELGQVVATRHLASRRLLDENRRHEDLGEQVELALAQAREDLAEAAIARQFDIEAQLPVLEASIADCVARQKELEGFVAALAARRREVEEELDLARTARGNRVAGGVAPPPRTSASSADAGRLAELEALARNNRIRERLATLKSRTGN